MKKGCKVEKWFKAKFGSQVYVNAADWDFREELNNYEIVTEQWKIILLKLGRKTPEFKPNDVIVTHQDLYLAGYHDHDEIVLLFEENLVIRFCPEEHGIEV